VPARLIEPFAETLEPRGEGGFVVRSVAALFLSAPVVSHAFDSRGVQRTPQFPPP
jgi:hypothetical protein